MRATPFYINIALRHAGNDYPESRLPAVRKGCYICGAKPVLRVAGNHGYCQHHAAEAWEAQAKIMEARAKWD